ncbi:MAG: DUF4091 domain-containing protein [Lentisphaeria bacterium]|nr:DUF4091 domain-containing protein [Lentisphaeria bacterium]
MKLDILLTDSLQKIFADEEFSFPEYTAGSALKCEVFSFQIACRCDDYADIEINSDSDLEVICREVMSVPCEVPAFDSSENPFVLRNTPGLYPDALMPLQNSMKVPPRQWKSFWVTIKTKDDTPAGIHNIDFKLTAHSTRNSDTDTKECRFELEVLPHKLPEQKLIRTEWFHADCIYIKYNTPCWSEKHWELLEKYFLNCSSHGINMLLTPLWTPPLDTAIGSERPTVQLLDIKLENGRYSFDFTRLGRWLDLAVKCKIKYFEISHPFTQWGAEHAPKIVVNVNGKDEKLFGWHTDSTGKEYTAFLRQLFPVLLAFLEEKGVRKNCFFHVSDEPAESHIPVYSKCASLIEELTENGNIIDALSSFEFYRNKLVKTPIPGNNHLEEFYSAKVSPLWTYYCCAQKAKVPNRFFNYPSARNRIMGVLLYVYDIAGFLQWGYNFWYSRLSKRVDIDPFRVTDADRSFPSGDAFAVYPGTEGPIDSIRHEVMYEALQDLRALRLLESRIGREKSLEVIHSGIGHTLTMENYPRSSEWIIELRQRINSLISVKY